MSKTHLPYDKSNYGKTLAACSTKSTKINGGGLVVKPMVFALVTLEENRCKKCEAIFLKRRNKERKEKNLPPVKTWNENFIK